MSEGKRDNALRRFLVGDLTDEEPETRPRPAHDGEDERLDDEEIKAPWHFKVLVIGTVGYLVYRLVWLIFWLTGHAWNG